MSAATGEQIGTTAAAIPPSDAGSVPASYEPALFLDTGGAAPLAIYTPPPRTVAPVAAPTPAPAAPMPWIKIAPGTWYKAGSGYQFTGTDYPPGSSAPPSANTAPVAAPVSGPQLVPVVDASSSQVVATAPAIVPASDVGSVPAGYTPALFLNTGAAAPIAIYTPPPATP